MADIRILQLLRNSTILSSKDEAISKINAMLSSSDNIQDGTPYICRYNEQVTGGTGDTQTIVKTVLGIAYKNSDGNKNVTVFDPDGGSIDEEAVAKLIEAELKKFSENISGDTVTTGKYVASIHTNSETGILEIDKKDLVASTDQVLTASESGITSTIKLKKIDSGLEGEPTVKEKYQLVGKDDVVLGDVITINKDQSFKEAKLIKKGEGEPPVEEDTLRLTYINSEGKDVSVNIPLGSFLNEAEFKNGLIVSESGEVSVSLSTNQENDNDNFLKFEGSEDGKKTLAVREMKTNVTKTTNAIPVAGGPLANLVSGIYDSEIPSGTDMQTLLMNLFCKEIYPNASVSNGNLTSSFKKPNLTITHAGGQVEVGTKINIPQFVGYEATSSATPRKYTGFDYGWSIADDDSKDADGQPAQVEVSGIGVVDGTYTVKRTYQGFNKETSGTVTTMSNAVAASAIIEAENDVVVGEGANKVKFEISGPGHSGTVVSSQTYYIVSNLGNTDSIKKVDSQVQQDFNISAATSASSEYTVTGYRNCFYGSKTEPVDINNENIRSLTPTNGVKKNFTMNISDGTKQVIIAFPESWGSLSEVNDKNAFGTNIYSEATFPKQTLQVNGAENYTAINYSVYVYSPDAELSSNTYTIVIK